MTHCELKKKKIAQNSISHQTDNFESELHLTDNSWFIVRTFE